MTHRRGDECDVLPVAVISVLLRQDDQVLLSLLDEHRCFLRSQKYRRFKLVFVFGGEEQLFEKKPAKHNDRKVPVD